MQFSQKKRWLSCGLSATMALLLAFSCHPEKVVYDMLTPSEDFSSSHLSEAPHYELLEYWAAHPDKHDLGDLRPAGIKTPDSLMQTADVFYLHPTTYYHGKYWNDPLDSSSGTAKNTQWNMANNASIFNDAQLYAPLYRQAAIICFKDMEGSNQKKALAVAYADVERAFDHFLEKKNDGGPFFIAGHSQGAYLGWLLIKNKIDGTALAERMVAAYLIGTSHISNDNMKNLKNITVCDDPQKNQCLVSFNTFADHVKKPKDWGKEGLVCVNPLTWQRDGGMADKALHQGYVKENGKQSIRLLGKDKPNKVPFGTLEAPLVAHTYARCESGALLVEAQDIGKELEKGNYHGIEMQLFHMDIRNNMYTRFLEYLKTQPEQVALE